MKTDAQLIAEYVAAGKVRRFPAGTTSGWDDLPSRMRFKRTAKLEVEWRQAMKARKQKVSA